MFSLIITIISIALVAVLALATLYYGGDAFNKGTAGAEASRLINEGQQVNGAVALAKADSATFTTIATLVSAGYLAQAPGSFTGNTADLSVTDAVVVKDADVSVKVCNEVQKRAVGSTSTTFVAPTQADAPTGQVYGCFLDSNHATANTPTFFYNM